MLEPILCRIKMLVSFLEDLTLIIFDDSLKLNQQLVSPLALTAKIVYYKISCTRKTHIVGQVL